MKLTGSDFEFWIRHLQFKMCIKWFNVSRGSQAIHNISLSFSMHTTINLSCSVFYQFIWISFRIDVLQTFLKKKSELTYLPYDGIHGHCQIRSVVAQTVNEMLPAFVPYVWEFCRGSESSSGLVKLQLVLCGRTSNILLNVLVRVPQLFKRTWNCNKGVIWQL